MVDTQKVTRHTIAFLLLLLSPTSCGQHQPLSQTSQAQLDMLSEWNYEDTLDIDSLVNATGEELIRQLKKGRIDLRDSLDKIDQITSKDSLIQVSNHAELNAIIF